jgi:hypothetical protein
MPSGVYQHKKHTQVWKDQMSIWHKNNPNSGQFIKEKSLYPQYQFKKGHQSWNEGKHLSEETKSKIRKKHIGLSHTVTLKVRKKLSDLKIGIMPKNMIGRGNYKNIKSGYYNINGKYIFF